MDRHRREESEPRRVGSGQDRRRLRHHRSPRVARPAGGDLRDHRHRRASARRSDHVCHRARPADADRKAARHRSRRIGPRSRGDPEIGPRRRGRLYPAFPPPLARGQGKMPNRRARRRHPRHLARVHEPAGGDRQLQAHRQAGNDFADGDLRHACARHLHVVPGRQDRDRGLCALDRQGAGPALPGHRRHRRHDHVQRRHRLSSQHFLGDAGDLAGRRLQPGGRHRRHHRRAHHRRHPPRHRAGGVQAAVGRLQPGRESTGRLHGQLSARRHGARRTARADGGGDRVVAQPHGARPADPRGDCGRGAQPPDADQGARPVGNAEKPVSLPLEPDQLADELRRRA